MADIRVEKKKNKPVWPWILGALLLVGIIWAVAEMGDETEDAVAVVEQPIEDQEITREPQSNVYTENEAVNQGDFVSYVNNKEIQERMGTDHEVTASALIKLSSAIEDLAQEDYTQQINELRQNAEEIQSNPQSSEHAEKVSVAFTNAANLLSQIQQNNFPEAESDVQEVKEKADKLQADKQLLNQKEEVKSFFQEAADAVEKMKEEETL